MPMPQDSRWDPEMLRFTRAMEAAALPDPIPDITRDTARHLAAGRARTEALNLPLAAGGHAMAESRDLRLELPGGTLSCRLHRPHVEGGHGGALPVMVNLHGGGWVWNSVDTHDRLFRAYAHAAGCVVLAPDYSLSPEAAFPVALEQVAGVVRHVAAHGASLGLDPARIVLGGDSAGANLALAAALLLRETDPDLVLRGLLLAYGCYDARCDTESQREFAEGFGLTRERMMLFWRLYAPEEEARLSPLASPLLADLRGLPPALLQVAELDVLRDDSLAMAGRMRDAGVEVLSRLFPGTVHGFLRAQGQVGAAGAAVEEAGRWLRERLA